MKKYISILVIILISIIIFLLQFQYQKTYQPHTYYQIYLDDQVVGVIESKDELEKYISKQGTLIKNQVIDYQEQLETLEVIQSIIQDKLANDVNGRIYLDLCNQYDELFLLVDEDGSFESKNREHIVELTQTLSDIAPRISSNKIENYDAFITNLEKKFLDSKSFVIELLEQNRENLSLTEVELYHLEQYLSNDMGNISYVKQRYMKDYVEKNQTYLFAEDVYSPLGIYIEKINTYHADLSTVEEVYNYIVKEKPCTIEGYQFRIKKTEGREISKYSMVGAFLLEDFETITNTASDDVIVYVTDEQVFKDAIEQLEVIFVGSDQFEKYKQNTQDTITETGSRINDVYVLEDITVKKTNISVGEKIYNDASELSSFLLYGENKSERTVYAKATDTILSLTYDQGITVEEFFLSNPTFTSVNNIFYENQPVVIAETNPKISVVVESFTVEDMEVKYDKKEQYDSNLNEGMQKLVQEGENGLERVSQNVRSVNGSITVIIPVSTTTLKSVKDEIIAIGTKVVPTVGSLSSWYWPTKPGYRLTSYYGYRNDPFSSGREFHTGLDIAGTGRGSPVYASNNGTVYYMGYQRGGYGTHMIIDHHNGYFTLYGHMSGYASGMRVGATVARGQTIGYVGDTGAATGPHLHFEIRTCAKFSCTVNPLPYLRK